MEGKELKLEKKRRISVVSLFVMSISLGGILASMQIMYFAF